MSTQAEITIDLRDAVVVISVSGEIDVFNAAAIGASIEDAIGPAAHAVVIDLSALEFLDSTAIRQLFALHALINGRRLTLRVVVVAGGTVERTLALVDFSQAAPMVTSLEQALLEVAPE